MTTVDPRESMRRLPRLVQPFLTWMTGVPLRGTGPRVRWNPALALVAGVVQTGAAVALGAVGLAQAWYVAIPVVVLSWPLTAGGLRRLDVVVVHQTLHKMFTQASAGNRIVSELVTTLTWRPPYDDNRKEHLVHHAFPCSMRDGDTLYLLSTGAKPGLSRSEFRRYLVRAVFSPKHHWSFFSSRMRANFDRSGGYRFMMAVAFAVATVAFLVSTGWWLQWLVLWVVPLTFFFQTQTLLYTLSEHRWWLFDNAERLTKSMRDQLTFGRFCGEATPVAGATSSAGAFAAWTRWWLRALFVYAPYRMCVLVGDTVQHDLHHVRPKCDWANSSWVRSDDLSSTESGRYYEAWGGLLSHVYVGNSVRDYAARPSVAAAEVS